MKVLSCQKIAMRKLLLLTGITLVAVLMTNLNQAHAQFHTGFQMKPAVEARNKCSGIFGGVVIEKSRFLMYDDYMKGQFLKAEFGFDRPRNYQGFDNITTSDYYAPLYVSTKVSDALMLAGRKAIQFFEQETRENGMDFQVKALYQKAANEKDVEVWAVLIAKKVYSAKGTEFEPYKIYYFDWGNGGWTMKDSQVAFGDLIL